MISINQKRFEEEAGTRLVVETVKEENLKPKAVSSLLLQSNLEVVKGTCFQ
jgi:hypothetical protein